MMHESKGQRIGKAPSLHLFHTTARQCMKATWQLFAVPKTCNQPISGTCVANHAAIRENFQVARWYVVRMSALIQLAQMKIQLALVQKQLAFWTQLAYNFRHCWTVTNNPPWYNGIHHILQKPYLWYMTLKKKCCGMNSVLQTKF